MDITINRDQLAQALYLANGIAERKGTIPILSFALLAAADGVLTCAATDLSISIVASGPATVKTPGSIAVDAKRIHEIVKGLPAGEIRLRVDRETWKATVTAGRAVFNVSGESGANFPKVYDATGATFVSVDAGLLADMISKTEFAALQDDSRPQLASVLFESDGQTGRMVSIDGHRLSKIVRKMPGGLKLKDGVLIPRKGVAEIRRALEGSATPCEISVHQGHMIVKSGGAVLAVKLGDGQYPPYEQVIPKDLVNRATIERAPLLEAVKRVNIMSSAKTDGIKFTLTEGALAVESTSPDIGDAQEVIDADYKGPRVAISFAARYVVEPLAEMSSDAVTVDLSGELDPCIMRPTDGSDYLAVVMPMRA